MQSKHPQNKVILIVDEEGRPRSRLEGFLRDSGYRTITSDITSADRLIESTSIDLVIAEEGIVKDKGVPLREQITEKGLPWIIAAKIPHSSASLYYASQQGAREFVAMPDGVERSELLDTVTKVIKDPSRQYLPEVVDEVQSKTDGPRAHEISRVMRHQGRLDDALGWNITALKQGSNVVKRQREHAITQARKFLERNDLGNLDLMYFGPSKNYVFRLRHQSLPELDMVLKIKEQERSPNLRLEADLLRALHNYNERMKKELTLPTGEEYLRLPRLVEDYFKDFSMLILQTVPGSRTLYQRIVQSRTGKSKLKLRDKLHNSAIDSMVRTHLAFENDSKLRALLDAQPIFKTTEDFVNRFRTAFIDKVDLQFAPGCKFTEDDLLEAFKEGIAPVLVDMPTAAYKDFNPSNVYITKTGKQISTYAGDWDNIRRLPVFFDIVMLLNYASQPTPWKQEKAAVKRYHKTYTTERERLGLDPTETEMPLDRFRAFYDFASITRNATHAGNMTEYVHRGLDALRELINQDETGMHPWVNGDSDRETKALAEGLQGRYIMNMLSACDRRINGVPRFSGSDRTNGTKDDYLTKEQREGMELFYMVAERISRTTPKKR